MTALAFRKEYNALTIMKQAPQETIKKIDDLQFTWDDIKWLGAKELAAFLKYDTKKDLLDWCANHPQEASGLVNVVGSKVGVDISLDLDKTFGSSGKSLLHLAVVANSYILIARLLQNEDWKKVLSIRDKYGDTPMQLAVQHRYTDQLPLMLRHKEGQTALSIKNASGDTPLHLVVLNRYTEQLPSMLKYKEGQTALSIKNSGGDTPVHFTARLGNINQLPEILKHKEGQAALAIQNTNGYTPLQLAILNRHTEQLPPMLRYPEGRKAMFLMNKRGQTAYSLLSQPQREELGVDFGNELPDLNINELMNSIENPPTHSLNSNVSSTALTQGDLGRSNEAVVTCDPYVLQRTRIVQYITQPATPQIIE
ncbi:MAG: ankyrin repeat domain-containing protein [Rickettsiales bacterium]